MRDLSGECKSYQCLQPGEGVGGKRRLRSQLGLFQEAPRHSMRALSIGPRRRHLPPLALPWIQSLHVCITASFHSLVTRASCFRKMSTKSYCFVTLPTDIKGNGTFRQNRKKESYGKIGMQIRKTHLASTFNRSKQKHTSCLTTLG